MEAGLLRTLKEWRRKRCKADGVPAFVVALDRTLAEIAAIEPGTIRELEAVYGMGTLRTQRYGDEILAIVERSSLCGVLPATMTDRQYMEGIEAAASRLVDELATTLTRPVSATMITHILRGSRGPKSQAIIEASPLPRVGSLSWLPYDTAREMVRRALSRSKGSG